MLHRKRLECTEKHILRVNKIIGKYETNISFRKSGKSTKGQNSKKLKIRNKNAEINKITDMRNDNKTKNNF